MSLTYEYSIPNTPKNGDDEDNLKCLVEYDIHKATRGATDAGTKIEPDEPAYIEIQTITIDGHDVMDIVDLEDVQDELEQRFLP